MTVKPTVDARVLYIHSSSKKRTSESVPLGTENQHKIVDQRAAQYNASASISEHTVQRRLLDMGLRSRRPTRVPVLTRRHCHTPTLRPGTSRLEYG
ncbi:hypothetical protein X975_24535, partial [Stegodyphus mimosarum]